MISAIQSYSALQWQCRRGMRELDCCLQQYLEKRYPTAEREEQCAFLTLLEESDDALWHYFYRNVLPTEPVLAQLVCTIRALVSSSYT